MFKNVKIHKTAEVDFSARIGGGTIIWNQAQVREGAAIGKNCSLGKDVYIDKNVMIGNQVRIQNGVSIYTGVIIKDDVLLGPHMVFTNDLYPRAYNQGFPVCKTLVKKGASIGANATIVCGNVVGEYAMVGCGSVVTDDVPDYGLVFGNPAYLRGFICRCAQKFTAIQLTKTAVHLECSKCKNKITVPLNIFNKLIE